MPTNTSGLNTSIPTCRTCTTPIGTDCTRKGSAIPVLARIGHSAGATMRQHIVQKLSTDPNRRSGSKALLSCYRSACRLWPRRRGPPLGSQAGVGVPTWKCDRVNRHGECHALATSSASRSGRCDWLARRCAGRSAAEPGRAVRRASSTSVRSPVSAARRRDQRTRGRGQRRKARLYRKGGSAHVARPKRRALCGDLLHGLHPEGRRRREPARDVRVQRRL